MDASPDSRPSLYQPYHFALACGALPLIAGISISLLWHFKQWDWLMLGGICALIAGTVLLLTGVFELAQFSRKAFRTSDLPRPRIWLSILACGLLFVLNFPVAGSVVATVNTILTSYTVTVHNQANEPLHDVDVSGGGSGVTLGTIPPGSRTTDRLWFKKDGVLELRARRGGTAVEATIDGYVTNSMGGKATVTINPDQTISIKNERSGRVVTL